MSCKHKIPVSQKIAFRCARTGLPVLFILLGLFTAPIAHAQWQDIGPKDGYEAPPYVAPPPPESRLHLIDNGDGTISDPDSGLMWAQKDSYADLNRCLNWHESNDYVRELKVGGHTDWRLPTLKELAGIYDDTKESVISLDHDPDQPLGLDEKFADGAAYWSWSADFEETDLTDCCARSFYFVKGMVHARRFSMCANGGVRPVRDEK